MKKIRIVANILLVMLCFAIFPYGVHAALDLSKSPIDGDLIFAVVPDGYTQVDFIQTTGTQYINTNISPASNTKLVARFASTNITKINNYMFGSAYTETANVCYVANDTSLLLARYGSTSTYSAAVADLNAHTITLSAEGITYDNTQLTTNTTSFSSSYLMYIGATNIGNVAHFGNVKIYEFKVYTGTTLTANFIPCKNASGVAGMYNLVNDQFYENAGTGSFIAGPEV